MDLKQLIADTASEWAALSQKIEQKQQRAKFLKSKVRKLERELERQNKVIEELTKD